VPPSTGKKKKARKVFGNVLTNGNVDHSLSYTPSPLKKDNDADDDTPASSKTQPRLAANLFSIEENTTSTSKPDHGRKSQSSFSQQSVSRSEGSTVKVCKPFSNVIGDKENHITGIVPTSIRVPSDKNSTDSKISIVSVAHSECQKSGRAQIYKKSTGQSKPTEVRSVNAALNAAKQAREKALKEKAKAAAMIRGLWKEEKEEALEFHEESKKIRQEQLNLQIQLSSQFSRAKARRNQQRRQVKRQESEKDSLFKSNVEVEHRQKMKELEDKRRRESIITRAKIRDNHRQGEEKLRLMKFAQEKALHEERESTHQAFQQYEKDRLASAKKNYHFRHGDAIRIRELHNRMEVQRLMEKHESFELMLAAERDVDEYHRGLAEQRRQSIRSRNAMANKQRLLAEGDFSKQKQSEHENYELKLEAERDVANYKKKLEEQRRESLAFRNKEGLRHRQLLSGQEAEEKKLKHEGFMLKFAAEQDVEAYKQKEAFLRRMSLAQRGEASKEIRRNQLNEEAERLQEEHNSWELKFAGEKDATEYREKLLEERRKSLEQRNQEARRQHEEQEKRRAQELQTKHESYELKWEGERDAQQYLKLLEDERRQSLHTRNAESWAQQKRAEELRSLALKSEHESYELKRAASKDVEAYLAKSEQERRESLVHRNKERARHAEVMEELISIAKAEETASYRLKWAADNDVKEYLQQVEEERRKSLRFRCEEGKRHREIEDGMRRKELMRRHEDVELRAAGKCHRIFVGLV
jgi:hypothetical protein